MIKNFFKKLCRKRKINSSLRDHIILSKADIEKLNDGRVLRIDVEKFLPEVFVCTEECYERMMSEVRRYNYD